MKQPIISIIIPVYNTEQYLDRCVESIVNQTYQNLDIVLVNDGSSDASGAMCDEWAKKDARIRVIHKKNEGVTIARKTGVENAIGEWITFVDSDDYLPEDALHTLYSHTREDIDIVFGVLKKIGQKDFRYKHFGEKTTIQYLRLMLKNIGYNGPYSRLIRKSLFDDFTFDISSSIKTGEDFLMNFRLGQKVRQVILLPDIVYCYVWRPGSAISNSSILNKDIRKIYNKTFNQSISPEYRKKLNGSIVVFWIKRYWILLKKTLKRRILE